MAYIIEFVEDFGYVHVVFSGDVTLGALEGCRDELKAALSHNGCRRLLVEGDGVNLRQSVAEEYEFTSEHRLNFPAGIRIALLADPETVEYFRFVENVSQNRGVNQKVFLDRDDALEWLLDTVSPTS